MHNYTEISGVLRPGVSTIRVLTAGRKVKVDTVVAQVTGNLLERLRQSRPFGVFAVFLRGCIPWQDVTLALLDADGGEIGTAQQYGGPSFTC